MKKLLFSLSYILFTFLFASLASAQEMTDSLYIAGEQLAYKKYSESKTRLDSIRNGLDFVNTYVMRSERRMEVSDRVAYLMASTPEYLAGTYVQAVFLTLALITVFMGSMLAYKEKILKKRLAYSTVSQVSYVLFGLALFTPAGFAAALIHVVFHSVIKNGLFLFAGTVIHQTGEERVEGLKGMGKYLPVSFWCFTFASLALVGIPPLSGFVSKWYLAKGAMEASVGVFSYIGPAVLLVSALLTAGDLLSITADGFFPGKDFVEATPEPREGHVSMLIPCIIFAMAAVLLGVCASPLYTFVTELATGLL